MGVWILCDVQVLLLKPRTAHWVIPGRPQILAISQTGSYEDCMDAFFFVGDILKSHEGDSHKYGPIMVKASYRLCYGT